MTYLKLIIMFTAKDIENIFYIWLALMAVIFCIGPFFIKVKYKTPPPKIHHSPHPLIRMVEGYNPEKYIEDN